MSRALKYPTEHHEDPQAVLVPFLNLLRSASPITLPPETLYGAITHFLSILSSLHLGAFVTTLTSSPSLWDPDSNHGDGIRHAVRLSASAKVSGIDQALGNAYFRVTRRQRLARQWLGDGIKRIVNDETSIGRTTFLVGLLEGVGDVPTIEWGNARISVEEEVVMSLAPMLQGDEEGAKDGMKLLCASMGHIAEVRLMVLDVKGLLPRLQSSTFASLSRNSVKKGSIAQDEVDIGTLAQALGRTITVLDHGGPSSRKHAWSAMIDICAGIKSTTSESEMRYQDGRNASGRDGQKTMLFAFLHPATAMLRILLHDDPPEDFHTSDMAMEILLALSSFTDLVDSSEGGAEGYDRVFYGCADIVAARGGTDGVKRLFSRLAIGQATTDAEAGFAFLLGEQFVNHLDSQSLRTLVILCQRQVFRSNYRKSFEAAHGFLIKLIESASGSLHTPSTQESFLDEMLKFYPSLVLKQSRDGDITTDQLRTAFPLIVKAASTRGTSRVRRCIQLLDRTQSSATDPSLIQTIRLTRIAIAPYIPKADLPAYLADVREQIMGSSNDSTERVELAALMFKTIIEDFPDESKRLGMEWWLEWRDRFQGRATPSLGLRARL